MSPFQTKQTFMRARSDLGCLKMDTAGKTIQSRPDALVLKEANPARSDLGCLLMDTAGKNIQSQPDALALKEANPARSNLGCLKMDTAAKTIQSRPDALALKEANPARSDLGCLKEANRKKRKLLCSQQEFPIFSKFRAALHSPMLPARVRLAIEHQLRLAGVST